jgi:hypothetical protein
MLAYLNKQAQIKSQLKHQRCLKGMFAYGYKQANKGCLMLAYSKKQASISAQCAVRSCLLLCTVVSTFGA